MAAPSPSPCVDPPKVFKNIPPTVAPTIDLFGTSQDENDSQEAEEGEIASDHESEENTPNVPLVTDQSAPKFKAGDLHLSSAAIRGRLRRLMTPRIDGTFKVSQQIVQDFQKKDGKERKNVELIFQMCGYDRDPWLLYECHYTFKNFYMYAKRYTTCLSDAEIGKRCRPRKFSSKNVKSCGKSSRSKRLWSRVSLPASRLC